MLTVGMVQMRSLADREGNLEQIEYWMREASRQSAQLVALPENCTYMGPEAGKLTVAEIVPGLLTDRLGRLARLNRVWLLAGSIPERSEDPARVYNTSVLFDQEGTICAVYRKIHLFEVDIPGRVTLNESRSVKAGDRPVVAKTPWCTLGLSICYDLRFPELYRVLIQAGAEVLFVPSAFTIPTGRDHWHVLLRSRAIENSAYVLAPAQSGDHGAGRCTFGHSLAVDPWGMVVADAEDGPGIQMVELDLDQVREVRAQLPSIKHLRFNLQMDRETRGA